MAQRFIDQEEQLRASRRRIADVEQRCNSINIMLNNEMTSASVLRKQLKQAQINAEDNEWMLQEQLAQLNNQLQQEREASQEIKSQLALTEAKLVEVESFLSSDRGEVFLKMEEDLAEAKLRVAELEANKDDLEMEIRRNATTVTSSGGGLRKASVGSAQLSRSNSASQGFSESRGNRSARSSSFGRSLLDKENAKPFPGFGST